MYNYGMRVAVCDGNGINRNSLKLMIYRYAERLKIDAVAEEYLCGNDMLASGKRYNMVFLDYNAEILNGMAVSRLLREGDCFCSIIFTSSENRFRNDIFKVSPSGFLTYPIKERDVVLLLDDYFRKKINGYPMLIKSGADTVCLNTNEIVYLEADNKHCVVHLKEKNLNCSRTMGSVYEVLPKVSFLKINRAFVINSEYINSFNSREVVLKTGDKLYISRNYRKDFKQGYFNFINTMQF